MLCKTKCVSLAIVIISIIYTGERSPPSTTPPQVGFREGGMHVDLTPYLCVCGKEVVSDPQLERNVINFAFCGFNNFSVPTALMRSCLVFDICML